MIIRHAHFAGLLTSDPEYKRSRGRQEVPGNWDSVRTMVAFAFGENPLISSRYEILSDSQAREVYDEHGLEGLAGGGGGVDPTDIFTELFTGGGFSFTFGPDAGMSRPRRGEDSAIPYEVTLEDLYNGKQVKMNMEKEIICGVCRGLERYLRYSMY